MLIANVLELGKPPREVRIATFPALIGRDDTAAVVLQDKFAGARHAEIIEQDGSYHLRDLGTPNGTTVGDKRLAPQALTALHSGDKIGIGACEIAIALPSARKVDGSHFVVDLDRAAEEMFADAGKRLYLPALLDVTRRLHGLHDAASICRAVAELGLKWLNAERALVSLLTKSTKEVALKDKNFPQPTFSTTIADLVMEKGRALVLRDPRNDASFGHAPSIVRGGALSAMAVPLWSGLGPEGMLYVDRVRDPERFEANDLEYAMIIACVAAQELEKAALVQRLSEGESLLRKENIHLRQQLGGDDSTAVLGISPAMAPVRAMLEQVAPSDVSILIHGETGTGKELLARSIHERSPRSEHPFVAINCGALPEQLLESELFGHKKGAFTGASEDRKGLCELASGGTLFLDEIGDMPPAVQVRMLRVLQEGEVRAVGADKPRKVDLRVIAASHKDLEAEVHAARFRQDLLYRLNVVVIEMPPLRARREDLPSLCATFVERFNTKYKKSVKGVSPEAIDMLNRHAFPGNIRELENEIQRAVVLSPNGGTITADILSPKISRKQGAANEEVFNLKSAVGEFERAFIQRALAENEGHREHTARALGLTRQGLFEKMKRLGLTERDEE